MITNGEYQNRVTKFVSGTSRRTEIAVYGGDSRIERLDWPKEYNLRFYRSAHDGGRGERQRMIASIKQRKIDVVIMLAKWMGHSDFEDIRRVGRTYCDKVITWTNGVSELCRQLRELVPVTQFAAVPDVKPEPPEFIESSPALITEDPVTVNDPPCEQKPSRRTRREISSSMRDEIFALAGKISQTEIGKRYGMTQSSVSYLLRGLKHGEKGGRTSIPRLPKHFETKKKKVQVAPIAAPAPVEVVPSAAIEKPPVIAALEKMANDLSAMANLLFESIGNIESRIGRIEVAMTANTKEDK